MFSKYAINTTFNWMRTVMMFFMTIMIDNGYKDYDGSDVMITQVMMM